MTILFVGHLKPIEAAREKHIITYFEFSTLAALWIFESIQAG